MRYRVEFETEDPEHAATIFREMAHMAEKGEVGGGDVYSMDRATVLGDWDFEEPEDSDG